MLAVTISKFGGPEKIEIVDIPKPVPKPGQVLIQVEAACVAPADIQIRQGRWVSPPLRGERYVLGWDLAGTVVEVAKDVSKFVKGDKVIGWKYWFLDNQGTQAEYAVINESALAFVPNNVDVTHATTLSVNGNTAAQALDILNLEQDQTLAIIGAAGMLGGFATELATEKGIQVLAIASGDDEEFLFARAAEFYENNENLARSILQQHPHGIDALFATAPIHPDFSNVLKTEGLAMSAVGLNSLPRRDIQILSLNAQPDGKQLAELVRLVEEEVLTLRVNTTLKLEEARQAHELAQKRGIRGRIVLVP